MLFGTQGFAFILIPDYKVYKKWGQNLVAVDNSFIWILRRFLVYTLMRDYSNPQKYPDKFGGAKLE